LGLISITSGKVTACDDKKAFSELSGAEFKARYLPKPLPGTTAYAIDFIEGRTDSEAIEKALSIRKPGQSLKLVLDRQTWIIDRAIILPSHTELVISNCTLKHANGVFDNFIRVAGIKPKAEDPHGVCDVEPTEDIRIIGLGNAVISGADRPYVGINPKTGKKEKYLRYMGLAEYRNRFFPHQRLRSFRYQND